MAILFLWFNIKYILTNNQYYFIIIQTRLISFFPYNDIEDLELTEHLYKFNKFKNKELSIYKINTEMDYKDAERIRRFLTEKGKIMPRRITGNCAKHQRILARAIKIARHAAFLAFQID